MQNTKTYVESLFNGYEENKNLAEFKEELVSHLNDKIADLIKNGMNENEAFQKASAQLGDVSVIADELSLKKKQEIYSEIYLGSRKYFTPKRTLFFILGGVLILFGLITSAIVWFATEMRHASLASGMLFVALGAGLLTFMGLTQETVTKEPLSRKRALIYGVCVALFFFGLLCGFMTYHAILAETNPAVNAAHGWEQSQENLGRLSAVSVLLAFVLPSVAVFMFLSLTEKDRTKQWVKQMREKEADIFADHATKKRFGMFCGAIWITAVALFFLLGNAFGYRIAWLIFLFAIAAQLFIKGMMMKK